MKERGFTLIEILIAIAMIGVLSTVGIAMLNPFEQIKKTRDAQRKNDLLQIRNALDAYNADNNLYPSSFGNKIKDDTLNQVIEWGEKWPPYIAILPKDSLSPQQDYYYKVSEDKTSYTVYARLERSNDPQIIPGSEDSPYPYNYAISSTNIAVALLLPTPTSTPTPTNTPTPTPTLVPGRDYKRVFVTSTQYSGNLGGLSGADSKCQTKADARGLGGTWKAWLSDGNKSAVSRLTHATVPYQLLDGTRIADNWNDLITAKQPDNTYLRSSINKNESNNLVDDETWTATWEDGSAALYSTTCSNWQSDSNTIYAAVGYSNARNLWWTHTQSFLCDRRFRLYCFEQ